MTVPHPEPDDYCYLTTTGRRTGRPHRIEIWYASSNDTLYLLAGAGRTADWVQNLSADPDLTVEVGGAVRTGRGRIIADAAEAERARALVFDKYDPRSTGDLTDWRDRALPVAIDLN